MLTQLKNFYKQHTLPITSIGFIVSLIFLIISSLGIFLNDQDFVNENAFLQSFFNAIGDWNYWLFIIVLALTIACGWIFTDLMFKRSKFNELMKTTSKAAFVRHQEEIESLAWKLGPSYMDIVADRKAEFKIRK